MRSTVSAASSGVLMGESRKPRNSKAIPMPMTAARSRATSSASRVPGMARLEVGFDQLAVHPAVGPQAQGHAVESQHLVGTDDRGRGADLRGVPQEALGARLDSRITGFAGDRHHVLRGRRHQRGPVEIDGRVHFSRITPNVKPATMYLRPITISTSGRAIAITPEAAISFQMISN